MPLDSSAGGRAANALISGDSLSAAAYRRVEAHLTRFKSYWRDRLIDLVVQSDAGPPPDAATYIRVNGQIPVTGAEIRPGRSEKPIEFSWYTKPLPRGGVEYRYRLGPEQPWSAWGQDTSWRATLLPSGGHFFAVDTRQRTGEKSSLGVAQVRFSLSSPYYFSPSKGTDITAVERARRQVQVSELYPQQSSSALLIGVADFLNPSWQQLEYVRKDMIEAKRVFTQLGFDVREAPLNPTKAKMLTAIQQYLAGLGQGTRAIIYISTHGFSPPGMPNNGYLAGYDCNQLEYLGTCLSIEDLERTIMELLKQAHLRHFLLILDTCASGLGIIAKGPYMEVEVARQQGAHVLTAGTANQAANPSRDGTQSMFTKYLLEGMGGAADLMEKDGVITLSELLIYVRAKVAQETQSAQTPTMGRLSGYGEMVFLPAGRKP